MRLGSLFAGIGGFDLAARWMGWSTRWYSEIEPYACRVMAKHFPEAENLGDITTITSPPPVDMLVGGFPCQDISVAGKGVGIGGSRSGLWKHYARLIGEVRPRWVVIENSPMLKSRGLGVVLQDLMALGYDAEWHCIGAANVGAPHPRDRIWIVAYPHGQSLTPVLDRSGLERSEASPSPRAVDALDAGRSAACLRTPHVANDRSERSTTGLAGSLAGEARDAREPHDDRAEGSRGDHGDRHGGRLPGSPNWQPEPLVGRVAHGVPKRVDRLRCLGNAVVPQVPFLIFNAIARHEACQAAGLSHV